MDNTVREQQEYAVMAASSYENYQHGSEQSEIMLQKLLPQHNIDKELSDEYSTVIIDDTDAVISYRGTQNFSDVIVDLTQVVPGLPLEKLAGVNIGRFKIAQDKYDSVKAKYPNKAITTTGHSLGSLQAFIIGKTNNVRSYGFNSASSPFDAVTNLGIKNTPENQFTHYYVAKDLVGLSASVLGSDQDKLVLIEPHKWISDLSTTLLGSSALGVLGGPIVAGIGLGLGSLATIIDLHSMSNFLPPESFKGSLESTDIAHRWVKSLHYAVKEEARISKRGRVHSFLNNEKIIINDLLKSFNKNFNKNCKKGSKRDCQQEEEEL
jgi:hypothetical protein